MQENISFQQVLKRPQIHIFLILRFWMRKKVKLLGVNLAGRLNHANTLLQKASKKYHVLAIMCNYMNEKKLRILMNAFITF